MAVKQFRRPYDYTPGQTKEVIEGEQHTIPMSPPYDIYLIHIPRKETPSTVRIDGFTEVESEPGPGQFQVHYTEEAGNGPLGRITFNAADAGKTVAVDYHACGTAIWAEDRDDGRPNIAEMQEVLERVQEAGGIDYGSSGFANVKAALDALVGVRIVEMGSNSNGEYVRWENGLQVCYARLVSSPASQHWEYIDGSQLGIMRSWTLPASFARNTFQCVNLDLGWGFAAPFHDKLSGAYVSASGSVRTIRIRFTQAVTVDLNRDFGADVFVIGRWK